MCGFFGFIPISSKKLNKSNEKKFKLACNRINHRGFTSETVSHKGALLYHTLLPLVNSQVTTKQPFIYEESVTLFNGQIYNWKEIYSKYKKYFFSKPNSDTEVISVLLNKIGENILNEFDGMFAISFIKFQPNETQLLLSRLSF